MVGLYFFSLRMAATSLWLRKKEPRRVPSKFV